MGYVQDKYTKTYFLRQDENGQTTPYGVIGLDNFLAGSIREQDKDILDRLDFTEKRVLDIGFGRGEALKYAKEHGASKTVGVDFSEEAVRIAKEFLKSFKIDASLYRQDILDFVKTCPKKLQPFDIVIMLDVVEHIPRSELKVILNNLHSIISQTAIVAINTPVFGIDNDVIAEGLHPKARDDSDDFPETAGMHCNRYTKESLRSFMTEHGFLPVSGHIFINYNERELKHQSDKQRWETAFKSRYPLKAIGWKKPEIFERAYSRQEREALSKKFSYRFIHTIERIGKAIFWRIQHPRSIAKTLLNSKQK